MDYLSDILFAVAPIFLGLVIERIKGEGKTWMDAGNTGSDLGWIVIIAIAAAGVLLAFALATGLSALLSTNLEKPAYWILGLALSAGWLYAVARLAFPYLEQSGPVQTGIAIGSGVALDRLLSNEPFLFSVGPAYAAIGALLCHFIADGMEFGFGLTNGYIRAAVAGAAGMLIAGVLIVLFGPPVA